VELLDDVGRLTLADEVAQEPPVTLLEKQHLRRLVKVDATAEGPERTLDRPCLVAGAPSRIAGLDRLLGLGGAEFRLPVLAGPLRYAPRVAVPLNLAVSIVTIVASLLTRLATVHPDLSPYMIALVPLTASAVVAAFIGPALAGRLTDARLERTILVRLVGIGIALIVEGVLPPRTVALARSPCGSRSRSWRGWPSGW